MVASALMAKPAIRASFSACWSIVAIGSTPDTWVRMQAAFDLAVALKSEKKIRVERYEPPLAA